MLDPYQQHSGYLEEERFESATKNSLNKKTVLGKKKKAGIDLIIFLFSILEFSLEEYIKHFKQMEHPFP
jgi:phage regulator Rha-like protein